MWEKISRELEEANFVNGGIVQERERLERKSGSERLERERERLVGF